MEEAEAGKMETARGGLEETVKLKEQKRDQAAEIRSIPFAIPGALSPTWGTCTWGESHRLVRVDRLGGVAVKRPSRERKTGTSLPRLLWPCVRTGYGVLPTKRKTLYAHGFT